jgi:hypothetical protein
MITHRDEHRLKLAYDGVTETSFPIAKEHYEVRQTELPGDIFA